MPLRCTTCLDEGEHENDGGPPTTCHCAYGRTLARSREEHPWRDPRRYEAGREVQCLGCGRPCRRTCWGDWCYGCNVERIDRIDRQFRALEAKLKE